MFQDAQSKVYLYFLFTFQNGALCYLQGFGVYFVSACVFGFILMCCWFLSLSSIAYVSSWNMQHVFM